MMHRTRLFVLAAAVAIGLTAVAGGGTLRAQSPEPNVFVDPSLKLDVTGANASALANERVSIAVRLAGPSVSQQLAASQQPTAKGGVTPLAAPALTLMRAELKARQMPVKRAIEAAGADVIDSLQTATNGFLVHARRADIAALARIPGVERIERVPLMTVDLAHSIPQIGATRVWQELGWDGTGTIVAVIDTGTDYTHKDFGGPGTEEAYTSNDPTIIESGTFPTAKVIGGVDLVGEIYSASCQPGPGITCTADPQPDDDPLDAANVAHGTHVAGIVGGMGIDGTDLGPGAAPGTKIVSIKVFGDPVNAPGDTSTDVVMSAINWATEHNLGMPVDGVNFQGKINVMNLSLGSSWGGESDIGNETVDAAVEAGITVVMSGGNAGNFPMIVGSNGTAEHALSVASSIPAGQNGYYITAEWTEGGMAKKSEPDAVELSAGWLPSLAEVGKKTAPLAWYGKACNDAAGAAVPPVQDVREKFALVERGDCTGSIKAINAAAFGAVGIIVFTNANPKASLGCDPCDGLPDIPGVMIDRDPGLALMNLLLGGTAVMGTLDPANQYSLADVVSGFSSRGPSRGQLAIKPQITGPGSSIVSALAGSGDGSVAFSGTSMSGPTVAGVAALLWQRNNAQKLGLGPLDIAALAMNYSGQVIVENKSKTDPVGVLSGIPRQGAGRVEAFKSAVGNTLLRSDDGIAELNFAMPQVTESQMRIEKKFNVKNLGAAAKKYKLSNKFVHADDVNMGVGLSFTPAEFTVAPGEDTDVTVTAVVNASRLREWDLRSAEILWDEGKLARLEIDGWVYVTEVDASGAPVATGDLASMPFYVLPRPQACVEARPPEAFRLAAQGDMVDQSWVNPCPHEGLSVPLMLGGEDPAESATDPSWPPKIDIQAIGTTYGLADPADPASPTVLNFATAVRGATHLPLDTMVRIYMDYNKDGKYDEVIFNVMGDLLGLQGAQFMFVTVHSGLLPDGITPDLSTLSGTAYFQPYDITDQTSLLTVDASELNNGTFNLASGTAAFNFGVRVDDNVDDYAVTDTFLGYDLAPDGMFDNKPRTFSWSQTVAECVHLLTDGNQDTGILGDASIRVPANAMNVAPFKLKLVCAPPTGGADAGVMFLNMANAQGTGAGFNVRHGRIGDEAKPAGIYLPIVLMNHAFNPETTAVMGAVGEGGTAGTVTLTQRGTKLVVALDLPGASTDAPHPAHIHTGSCAAPGGIYKDLSPVENGISVTWLDGVTLAEVLDGTHYVNVHKSAAEMGVAISCGDLPKP
jgi:subtilisin family serine protease